MEEGVSAEAPTTLAVDEDHSSGPRKRTLASPGRSGSAGALPLRVCQSRRPALAVIIGARRMWTVAMISSGSMPWR
jgi:hypothetical protein